MKIKWNFKNSYFIPWQHHINEISWYQLSCSFLCFMCCLNTWMYLKLYPHELTWISIYAFYEALLGSKLDLHSFQIFYKNMSSKLILFLYTLTTHLVLQGKIYHIVLPIICFISVWHWSKDITISCTNCIERMSMSKYT